MTRSENIWQNPEKLPKPFAEKLHNVFLWRFFEKAA
jgi:hypothetical protein